MTTLTFLLLYVGFVAFMIKLGSFIHCCDEDARRELYAPKVGRGFDADKLERAMSEDDEPETPYTREQLLLLSQEENEYESKEGIR